MTARLPTAGFWRARALLLASALASTTVLASALALGACSAGEPGVDTGLDGLALVSLQPATVVPGTRFAIRGRSFVGAELGDTRLRLRGTLDGVAVNTTLPARFVDFDELEVSWPGGRAAHLPQDAGAFTGEVLVEVDSTVDGATHATPPLHATLDLETALEPALASVQSGVIFVNEPLAVEGSGLLLGGDEGQTFALVEGCFTQTGQTACVAAGPFRFPSSPKRPTTAPRVASPSNPRIAGIHPGAFTGKVHLVNRQGHAAGDVVRPSAALDADYDVVPPAIFSVAPTEVSLGQYVEVRGGGFVGAPEGSPDQALLVTTLQLDGSFRADGAPAATNVSLTLVPEFVAGPLLRYVPSESDDLGRRIDLRKVTGTFTGTVRPVVQFGADTVIGDPKTATLAIAPVKQVVWLHFEPSYVESLRHFGLRAVDERIRARIVEVARRDYAGVNMEFRTEAPDDFALFARVDLAGPDPNALGLLGYDNTPGKDVGNERLYDQIGGVNAITQEGGFPGYGGIFVESLFGFSEHPGDFADRLDGADPLFDAVFDPFRPDRGGRPVVAADLAAGVPARTSGAGCPAASSDRPGQIACAIYVLGSLVGTTMTHEVGHSLGLANPYGDGFHDDGDQPNRLMDAGGARSFTERAELAGDGPAVFCDAEYDYLRTILPSEAPAAEVARPGCGF